VNGAAVDVVREELERYRRDLAALLSALDSGVEPEALGRLEQQFSASFEAAAQVLAKTSAGERSALAGQLAELRSLAALAHEEAGRARTRIGERLVNVARAREALRQADRRTTGGSCDVAG
jgi:hypothetical protein